MSDAYTFTVMPGTTFKVHHYHPTTIVVYDGTRKDWKTFLTLTAGSWDVSVDQDVVWASKVDSGHTVLAHFVRAPNWGSYKPIITHVVKVCQHQFVEMGFMHSKLVCKYCDEVKA